MNIQVQSRGSDVRGPSDFAVIIGGMKCGTTSLFEILGRHPEIAASRVKESNFFSHDDRWTRGWDWYVNLWDWDEGSHTIALEASPAYSAFPDVPNVPERIASIEGAEFRFIYMMRNPLDQIPSNIRHTLFAGWGQSADEGIAGWMIDLVRYATQIDRYLLRFPSSRILLLTLEEFQSQPEAVLRRVCSFLGVDPEYQFERVSERYNSGDAYEMSPLWARIVGIGWLRKVTYALLPRHVRHRIRALLPKISRRNTSLGRYELTTSEEQDVIREIASDLRRLQSEHRVDIDRFWSLDLSSSIP